MKNLQLLIGILSLLIGACSPVYYVPNAQNVPMISEKDELSIVASTDEKQINVQAAYGITKNLAVQANYFTYRSGDSNRGKADFFEVGLGLYHSDFKPFNFEIYGLFGAGNLLNDFRSNTSSSYRVTEGYLNAHFVRYGIQPVFALKTKYFTAAISARMVALHYDRVNGNLTDYDEDQVDYLNENSNHFFVEPAFTLQGGLKNFKIQLQYVYSGRSPDYNFPREKEIFTLGAVINVNTRKK